MMLLSVDTVKILQTSDNSNKVNQALPSALQVALKWLLHACTKYVHMDAG